MMIEICEKIAGQIAMSDEPGETIRRWREEFRISESELAKYMRISPSVISDYEKGRRKSPGIASIRKIVNAMIEIDSQRGGSVQRRFSSGVPTDALIDIKDYNRDIGLPRIVSLIHGTNVSSVDVNRQIRGYTIIDGIKAALSFSYSEYNKLYGWSSQRIIFLTEVKLGRSPMIAIRAHPLKPAAVVYIQPGNIDALALKLAELENIPLISTDMPVGEISRIMSSLG
ncbi:MAG: helix-turn-helix domain-containing protein [Candidatus Thermoplasmatota archaeon]|nr:helix-turn-helix domain-containing protein [Candidatus Thermoplasmatota archaeon]